MKINDINSANDILPYIKHLEEADQVENDHQNRYFLVRSQEAVANCNFDTSNIMKENEHDDPPWITEKISICNEITQYIKKYVPTNIMKNIYIKITYSNTILILIKNKPMVPKQDKE